MCLGKVDVHRKKSEGQHFMVKNSSSVGLRQGCPKSVLEGRCPAGFRCFPAPTHPIQMKWISSKDC